MNGRIATLALVFGVVFCGLAADLARAQPLPIYTASSSTISVKDNSYFLIAQPSNPTTGYNWSVKGFSRSGVVQILGSNYIPPTSGLMGAGGTYVYLLKAIGPGITTLTLTYARSFGSSGETTRTFQITVTP